MSKGYGPEEKKRWPTKGLGFGVSMKHGRLTRGRYELLKLIDEDGDKTGLMPVERREALAATIKWLKENLTDHSLDDLSPVAWKRTNSSLTYEEVRLIRGRAVEAIEAELDRMVRLTPDAEVPPPAEPEPPEPEPEPDPNATKVCPDCAEEIKAAARVCRYCGYRFSGGVKGAIGDTVEAAFKKDGPEIEGEHHRITPVLTVFSKEELKTVKAKLKEFGGYREDRFQSVVLEALKGEDIEIGCTAVLRGNFGVGNLLLTETRLLYLRHRPGVVLRGGIFLHEFKRENVEWVEAAAGLRKGELRVAVPGKIWHFADIKPKQAASEIATRFRSA